MEELPRLVAQQVGVPPESVTAVRIIREALDARKKREICFRLHVGAQLEGGWQQRLLKRELPNVALYIPPQEYRLPSCSCPPKERIVVVGLGPAGLFSAYFLAKHGYTPLVLERGKEISARMEDVELFWKQGRLNTQSNVMFGEGGAGTFSDGKLTARSKDPRADVVLKTLVEFGAPEDILVQAKPHVGTDKLRAVVEGMRREIQRLGGQVRFETRLDQLEVKNGQIRSIEVETEGRREKIPCSACILAIGQGARDTYRMLLDKGLPLIPKAFAVGVRVEHPQSLIDKAQLGPYAGHPKLGAAEYRLTAQADGRGVYSFCMCPGGLVVASSSGPEQVVTNGMSYHARNEVNANAAIVVQVSPRDFGTQALSGVEFQQMLERKAYFAGGGDFCAPAQRMEDFLQRRHTKRFGEVQPSYRPGVKAAALHELLPDFIANGIAQGVEVFARQLKGFDLPDAVLTGVETRTSAPVRIPRDEKGQALGARGVYPVGEGAGYAGGIVSAAVDGMLAAERVAAAQSEE